MFDGHDAAGGLHIGGIVISSAPLRRGGSRFRFANAPRQRGRQRGAGTSHNSQRGRGRGTGARHGDGCDSDGGGANGSGHASADSAGLSDPELQDYIANMALNADSEDEEGEQARSGD